MAGRGRGMTMPAWMTQANKNGELSDTSEDGLTNKNATDAEDQKQNGESKEAQFTSAQSAVPMATGLPIQSSIPIAPTVMPALAPPRPLLLAPPIPPAGLLPRAMPLPTPPSAMVVPGMTPVPGMMPVPPQIPPQIPPQMAYPVPQPMPGYPPHLSMPGMGMPGFMPPGAYPQMPPRPMPLPLPGMAMPPRMPFPLPPRAPFLPPTEQHPSQPQLPPPPQRATDPNNDITCWAEHKSEHGRRYWYNVATQQSTYDKPFCLKTPEERAIPACPWKEYVSAEGKIYYSNGTESKWDVPEEYRIWKEKVEAAEKRLPDASATAAAMASYHLHNNTNNPGSNSNNNGTTGPTATNATGNAAANHTNANAQNKSAAAVAPPKPLPVFASLTEAMEAFKDMLAQHHVSSIAKFKDVSDMCSADPFWEALKTTGERRQALAEYQTKRVKLEKEEAKAKAKKHREAFLRMLAEHTDIDVRTRWRQAQEMLKEDIRFKNVEDSREREDLFQEFVGELEKKERADRQKQKDRALQILTDIFHRMREPAHVEQNIPLLTPQSTWHEHKETLLSLLLRPDLRAIDETDIRRAFQDYVTALQETVRQEEKQKRELWQKEVDLQERQVLQWLTLQAQEGAFITNTPLPPTANTANNNNASSSSSSSGSSSSGPYFVRYKDIMQNSSITSQCSAFHTLQTLFSSQYPSSSSATLPGTEALSRRLHHIFDRWMENLAESYRNDRKVFKKVVSIVLHPQYSTSSTTAMNIKEHGNGHSNSETTHRIEHDTKFQDVFSRLLHFAQLTEINNSNSIDAAKIETAESAAREYPAYWETAAWKHYIASQIQATVVAKDQREEGEEVEAVGPAAAAAAADTKDTTGSNESSSKHRDHRSRSRSPPRATNSRSSTNYNNSSKNNNTTSSSNSGKDKDSKDSKDSVTSPSLVQAMVLQRAWMIRYLFEEQLTKAKLDYEDEMRYRKKAEEKFVNLLKETVYLSDHVHYTWDEVKALIYHRSAYEALTKSDRKRLFAAYMLELQGKFSSKAQAMKVVSNAHHTANTTAALAGKKRERSPSPAADRHNGSSSSSTNQRARTISSTAVSATAINNHVKQKMVLDEPEEGEEREEGEV